MSDRRVAVIGAGLAGLAAACRLQALGLEPVLFEGDTVPGGVVRTHAEGGWVADTGPVSAAAPHPDVRALLTTAGLSECTVPLNPVSRRQYVVHRGAPVVVPSTTAELVASPLLSLSGRLRMLAEPFIAPSRGNDDETADAFARRRVGDEVAERMFDPRIGSMSGGDASRLLARYAFPAEVGYEKSAGSLLRGAARARMDARRRARRAGGSGSWSCAAGMGELPKRLAESLREPVRLGVRIASVTAAPAGVTVLPVSGSSEAFRAAVLAVPAHALARLRVEGPGGASLEPIATMPCATVAVVSLGFRRGDVDHPLDGYRLLVPSRENRAILSAIFTSSVLPGRAPEGHVLVTAFVGGTRRPDLLDRSDADLVKVVAGEFRDLLGARGSPAWSRVTRWPDALPQAVAGHAARLAAADQIESDMPQVAFCGSWRDGLAVSETLLSGVRAAERVAARCGPVPDIPIS